jgi:hypothetical protein
MPVLLREIVTIQIQFTIIIVSHYLLNVQPNAPASMRGLGQRAGPSAALHARHC